MCTVCGCAGGGAVIEGSPARAGHGDRQGHQRGHTHGRTHGDGHDRHGHDHAHPLGHDHDHPNDHAHTHGHDHHDHAHPHGHAHAHDHGHDHGHDHDHRHGHPAHDSHPDHTAGLLDYGAGPAHAHAPGLTQARMIEIETGILDKNDAFAAENRRAWAAQGVMALNLVSSPGSGKTTLLVRTIGALAGRCPVAVIEGDQQTSNDADRIRQTGAPAIQINTGKGCHLDAHMVGHAAEHLAPPPGAVLFIENVGNLVCPAAFDLGEAARVAILSVTEGEDKPLKYPDMFASADVVLITKTDLAPHCDVDLDLIAANIARINPQAAILPLSSRSGEGFGAWIDWLMLRRTPAEG